MSPKSGIFSLTLQLWEHQISPDFAFSARILLDLGQEKGISLRSCLSSSADCSSKMLIPENSRGIQGHAALLELLSALKNSLFPFSPLFPARFFPSFPFMAMNSGKELKYPFFWEFSVENPIWKRPLPSCPSQNLIDTTQGSAL